MYEDGQFEDDDANNVINELEEELAKKNGLTRDQYRNLLRQQEG